MYIWIYLERLYSIIIIYIQLHDVYFSRLFQCTCFHRRDISNLMEKLVGWKSTLLYNGWKYKCNGFEFKFGIRLADGIHKEKRIKIHFTKYKSSTRVVSILRFLVILILCIIWRDVFYTKCNKYCTTLNIFQMILYF